jgi:Holliday junction resolvasome RuvABC endonuclease subunit
MPQRNSTIFALDPGLRDLGFSALRRARLLDSGVLTLRAIPPMQRLRTVRTWLERWIELHDPDVIVVENIPRRPLDSLAGLPALGRLLRRLARRHGIEMITYSAKTARRTVVGDGWAGKAEVVKAIAARYPQLRVYRGQDRKWKDRYWQNMFDAIALALHHQTIIQPPSRSR